jgi:hypothetical protein
MPFHQPHPSQRSLGGPGLSHLLRPSSAVWLALQTTCLASLAPPLFCRQEIRAMPACRRTAGTIQQRPFQAAAFPSQKHRASFDIPWGPDARPFAAQRHTAALESGLEQACRLTPSTAAKVGGMAPARFHGWRKQTKRQISWVPVRSVHAKGGIGATRSAVPAALLPFWLPACFGMRPQTERLTGGRDRFSSRGSEDMLFGGGVSYAAGPPGPCNVVARNLLTAACLRAETAWRRLLGAPIAGCSIRPHFCPLRIWHQEILRASSWPGGGKHGPSSGAVHRTRIPPGGATPVGGAFHFLSADDRKPDKQP